VPHSGFWQRGSQWLGRCAATGQALPQPHVPGVSISEQWCLTSDPRRYGWHATLKAPFTLADGVTLLDVQAMLQRLCCTLNVCTVVPLKVALMGDFLALVPEGDPVDLRVVVDACVQGLHPLAAPLSPAELTRRRGAGLSPRQDELLLRWGYPHVLEQFRFHFSLTGSLAHVPDTTRLALAQAAQDWFRVDTEAPLHLDAVSLFEEPSPGADFRWLGRTVLGS
jgi:hypothetical protein